MKKNFYLSRGEQSIHNSLPAGTIEKTEDIVGIFPEITRVRLNKINSGLASKGYLKRLKKGTYIVQDRPSDAPVITNPYTVALSIYDGYIGFSSALRLYNLLDYEPFTIFVVTDKKSGEKKFGEYIFKAVSLGKKALGMTYREGVYVSTVAKTFFDCFYKPQYAGGYSEITKAIYEAKIDWPEFIQYFAMGTDSFCQRTGYILDIMNKETGKVPQTSLDYLRHRIKANTRLVPTGPSKGKYSNEWKLIDNLGKDNILSWWYHG